MTVVALRHMSECRSDQLGLPLTAGNRCTAYLGWLARISRLQRQRNGDGRVLGAARSGRCREQLQQSAAGQALQALRHQ